MIKKQPKGKELIEYLLLTQGLEDNLCSSKQGGVCKPPALTPMPKVIHRHCSLKCKLYTSWAELKKVWKKLSWVLTVGKRKTVGSANTTGLQRTLLLRLRKETFSRDRPEELCLLTAPGHVPVAWVTPESEHSTGHGPLPVSPFWLHFLN